MQWQRSTTDKDKLLLRLARQGDDNKRSERAYAMQLVRGTAVSTKRKREVLALRGTVLGHLVAEWASADTLHNYATPRRLAEFVDLFERALHTELREKKTTFEQTTCRWIDDFLAALSKGLNSTKLPELPEPLEEIQQQANEAKRLVKGRAEQRLAAAEMATSKRMAESMQKPKAQHGELASFAPHATPTANDALAHIFGRDGFDEHGQLVPDSDAEEGDDSEWNRKRRRYVKTKSCLLEEQPSLLALRGQCQGNVKGKTLVVYYDMDGNGTDVGLDAVADWYDDCYFRLARLHVVGKGGECDGMSWPVLLEGDSETEGDEWYWKNCPHCDQPLPPKSFGGCGNAGCANGAISRYR